MLIKCPSCGRSLQVPDTGAGRSFRCPCGTIVQAAAPSVPPPQAPRPSVPPPPPPAAPGRASAAAATPVAAAAGSVGGAVGFLAEAPERPKTWKWVVEKLGPWGTSLVIHVVLLLCLGMITVWVQTTKTEPVEVAYIPPSDKPHPNPKPSVDIETTNVLTDAEPMATKISTKADAPMDVIGVVDTRSAAWNTDWGGVPYGSPTGGTGFFGIRGRGKRFVYLIDHSSSMGIGNRMEVAKNELIRSLSKLNSKMQFKVIFFQDGKMEYLPSKGLLPGSLQYVQGAAQWMKQFHTSGYTDPRAALTRAFQLQPDVIFLLTDGEFHTDVVRLAQELSSKQKHRVKIHTIALATDEGAKGLQQIARESGGTYKFVRGEGD